MRCLCPLNNYTVSVQEDCWSTGSQSFFFFFTNRTLQHLYKWYFLTLVFSHLICIIGINWMGQPASEPDAGFLMWLKLIVIAFQSWSTPEVQIIIQFWNVHYVKHIFHNCNFCTGTNMGLLRSNFPCTIPGPFLSSLNTTSEGTCRHLTQQSS